MGSRLPHYPATAANLGPVRRPIVLLAFLATCTSVSSPPATTPAVPSPATSGPTTEAPSTTSTTAADTTSSTSTTTTTSTAAPPSSPTTVPTSTTATPTTTAPLPEGVTEPPEWLGTRPLETDENGNPLPAETPPELSDRRFVTEDLLPPPEEPGFHATIGPVPGDVLERSTWSEECPVGVEGLAYVTVTFVGFDGRDHTGELLMAAEVADDIVEVFRTLYEARFPIEEMRIASRADLDAPPTGDGNSTTMFVCRPVTGGQSWSEHARGLAIDINPFHNPYVRGDLVLPELARDYVDRDRGLPGMITEGDAVTQAFDRIGWEWGGRWSSLKDYQHFSATGR